MSKTVVVPGGTDFIGDWTIVELLKRGYSVRTTVRSLDKALAVHYAALGSKTRLQLRQGAGGVGLETASSGNDDPRFRPKHHCNWCRLT